MKEILKILLETEEEQEQEQQKEEEKVVFILILLLVVNSLSFLRINEKIVLRVVEERYGEKMSKKCLSFFPSLSLGGSY